ncbi:MAG: squalene/phytoene synthase family protein [Myxococcota bacterium]|nr:squalene/phytoene synthase family protein [Myxococcota bacterium]
MAEPAAPLSIEQAYAHCAGVTRASGSSFLAAFWLFPQEQRRALHAVYAFCRMADDIADDPAIRGDRGAILSRWRAELVDAYLGKSESPVGIALGDAVSRFPIPQRFFDELLDGVEFDLTGGRIERFEDLERYCYRVASTVGLIIVGIRGFEDEAVRRYATDLGIAVQLTNVLRDVGEDAASGRIYLAREDLDRLGVDPELLLERRMTEEVRLLLALYAERARIRYERAHRALPDAARRSLRPAHAMGAIYRDLLDTLQSRGFPCLGESLRLSRRRRLAIAAGTWLGVRGVA